MGTDHQIDLDRFERQWRKLVQIDRIYKILYIPVDHKDRDKELKRVADRIEEDIAPKWVRVGHMGGNHGEYHGEIPEIDWDFIYDLPMIKKFYVKEDKWLFRAPKTIQ